MLGSSKSNFISSCRLFVHIGQVQQVSSLGLSEILDDIGPVVLFLVLGRL